MPRKRRKKSWEIWQRHHLEYGIPDMFGNIVLEKTVKITRTEHFFLTRIESYAKAHRLSPGMHKGLRYLCKKYPLVISKVKRSGQNELKDKFHMRIG